MYKIDGTTISLTRGDSLYVQLAIKQGTQTYTPAEGDVIKFTIRKTYSTPILIQKTISHDTLVLHLLPSDTKELPYGRYVYDVELTTADGDVDTFIDRAAFVLTEEVT